MILDSLVWVNYVARRQGAVGGERRGRGGEKRGVWEWKPKGAKGMEEKLSLKHLSSGVKVFICSLFRVSLFKHRVGNWKFLFAGSIRISTWKMIFSILCFFSVAFNSTTSPHSPGGPWSFPGTVRRISLVADWLRLLCTGTSRGFNIGEVSFHFVSCFLIFHCYQ